MAERHFTARLTTDANRRPTDHIYVVVQEGETAADNLERFSADTTVLVGSYDLDRALSEAKQLLNNAGWRLAGTWIAVDSGYVVAVERLPFGTILVQALARSDRRRS